MWYKQNKNVIIFPRVKEFNWSNKTKNITGICDGPNDGCVEGLKVGLWDGAKEGE